MTNETIVSYKGFDKNFQCRGFQFEGGTSYSVSGAIKACENGFHGCTNSLDVWGYYGPGISRFAVVEQSGQTSRHEEDSKIASAEITIKAELTLPEFIKRGVDYLLAQVDWKGAKETNTGNRSAATNTGYQSVATNTGDQSVATNTGGRSVATNTGYQSVATNTGGRSVATNTGDQSVATNTGDQSVATNIGKDGVALASGYEGCVSGTDGCALFLVERNENYEIVTAWAGIVGRDGIKSETLYTLKNGTPVEWVDED